ncbi:glutathione S-transferase [Aureimonas endophytica]|uniref:Glutathione S-transferase n=1 Tax=Aureimonas endophytica TaxID=2027858 RepID=A0A917EAC4_9HYPH|nr:glutathione S-transferase [Aureimonas endophytica]GGE18955.1 glutathione S-transferase [Aureimonas endophytica]
MTMRLIGMLDSPYVRRVAVSLHLMELPFAHEPLSVFGDFDAFAAINPVVKAPSLVTEDGVVLMDSTLILDFAERLAPAAMRLTPVSLADHARSQHLIGLALAACEKVVQTVYEFRLRPEEKRHAPWLDRVGGQARAGFAALEAEIGAREGWLFGPQPSQADVTLAVVWSFAAGMRPELADPALHPRLAGFAARAEGLPAFLAAAP